MRLISHLHLLAQVLVERSQRLVEEQHVGIEDEAAGERDALLLPARELARIPVGEWLEPDELEHLAHTRVRSRAFGMPRIRSGKAMLRATVMCGNSA